jgi:hypothetical protein
MRVTDICNVVQWKQINCTSVQRRKSERMEGVWSAGKQRGGADPDGESFIDGANIP